MKKAKKLLVTLLILTFVLSTLSVGFAAESTAVTRSKALGILKGDEQGNLNLDKPITRAEALALIVRISGLEKSADLNKGQTRFSDVPAGHWAEGYINLGVGQGFIKGYPDGTFKPSANVTYAEMAMMLLNAMNYAITVEGLAWPAGVMGKADELDLFDDVNATPNLPALRGDVVQMIDNSLTVYHLVQTGYGDLRQYEEGDKNFLSKLKVTELKKVKVDEIAKVNSKLDDDEIKLDGKVYTLKADVSAEAIFGLKVDAWVNDDDEVFFVKVKTDEKDILFDTVGEDASKTEVNLKVADDDYKFDEDAVVYVNFKKVKNFTEIKKGYYGKVVLDKGDVVFANLFDFDTIAVVTKVDKDVVEYVENDSTEDEIDLEDYDAVYVYGPDFKAADVKDIAEDSAIFFWENDDDEVFIIVKNEAVKGVLERVQTSKIKVDGATYDKADEAIVTLDDKDSFDIWSAIADIEDLLDEDVEVVLDLNGDALLVIGVSEATSGTMYGVVTYAKDGRNIALTVFGKDGKEVEYVAAKRDNVKDIVQDKLGVDYFSNEFAAISFKLNSDSEIAKDTVAIATYDDSVGKVTDNVYKVASVTKDADKKLIETANGNYYITSDTLIIKALDKDGDLDPTILKNDKVISNAISSANSAAIIFGTVGKNAKMIVFTDKLFTGVDDDTFYGVVTGKPWKEGKNYLVEIDVFGEGKAEYKLADETKWSKGQVVAFTMNNDDKAVLGAEPEEDVNYNKNYKDGFVTLPGDEYIKVNSNAVIYNLKYDDGVLVLDKKIGMSKLDGYKYITYLEDEDEIVAAVVSNDPVADEEEPDEDELLTEINAAANGGAMLTALSKLEYASFDSLSSLEKARVANKVLAARPAEGGFATVDAVKVAIDTAIGAEL